jgi:hypothetical protein
MSARPCTRRLAAIAVPALLAGCIVVPRTVASYDARCHVVTRHMTVEAVQVAAIQNCTNQGCTSLLVAGIASVAVTAIVSGSIAVVGNMVYWAEERGDCRPDAAGPAGPALPPGSAASAVAGSAA